jgi:trimethylamine---corrinoid protein Co-methyltransferase
MKPTLNLLTDHEAASVIQEAIELLNDPGLVVYHPKALDLFEEFGAKVDREAQIIRLSAELIAEALKTCPPQISLYDLNGNEKVRYGSGQTFYNPGSSALQILDPSTRAVRSAQTQDLAYFVQLVEVLDPLDSQSTALVCSDVPESIQDLYRLYVALNYLNKPIVTGVFDHNSWKVMFEMLVAAAGSSQNLAARPIAVFDICPTSPLKWSFDSIQSLLDNARASIPIQIISMPMAGATSPVTLAGTLVQGTAENLSGVVLSQLAQQGAPVIWGGSPAVFDMKNSTAPMAAPGTWLLGIAYAQIGKVLGLPTQAYLGISDSKQVDFQAGLETAPGTLLAGLAGIDMVSGAGMLAYENCQSPEKLLLDAEIISQMQHFLKGIRFPENPLGLDIIQMAGHQGNFISLEHTFQHFRTEVHYPSPIIDRQQLDDWQISNSQDAWQRANSTLPTQLEKYPGPTLDLTIREELRKITALAAKKAGLDSLPKLPN